MTAQRQNPDGSWSPAEPLGWQPGIDWEVYRPSPTRARWEAVAYDEDVCVAAVRARTRFGLRLRIARAARRLDR